MDSLSLFNAMRTGANPIDAYAAGSRIANEMLQIQARQGQQVFQNLFAAAQQMESQRQYEETMAFKRQELADQSARGWYNAETQRMAYDPSRQRSQMDPFAFASSPPQIVDIGGGRQAAFTPNRFGGNWDMLPQPSEREEGVTFDIPQGYSGPVADLIRPQGQTGGAMPTTPAGDQGMLGSPNPPLDMMMPQAGEQGPNPLLPPPPQASIDQANAAGVGLPMEAPIPPAEVIMPTREMGQAAPVVGTGQRQMGSANIVPAPQRQQGGIQYPKGEANAWFTGDHFGGIKTWTDENGQRMAQRIRRTSSGFTTDVPYKVDKEKLPPPMKIGSVTLHPLPLEGGAWTWREEEKDQDKPLSEATVYMVERDLEKLEAERLNVEQRLRDTVSEATKKEQFKSRYNREATSPQDLEEGAKLYHEPDRRKLEAIDGAILRRKQKLGIESASPQPPTATTPTAPASSIGRQYLNRVGR